MTTKRIRKPCRNPEMNKWPHINGHAGDAGVVSTVRSGGKDVAFVGRSEVVKGAPLMAKPIVRLDIKELFSSVP